MIKKRFLGIIGALIAIVTVLASCEAVPPASSSSGQMLAGSLRISITDAPPKDTNKEVWLTITSMEVHLAGNEAVPQAEQETEEEQGTQNNQNQNQNQSQPEVNGGWLSLELKKTYFDLLTLQGGLITDLAVGNLAAGKYTQIRMDVEKVEIKVESSSGIKTEIAKLPSNTLKFVHPFEIVGGGVTEILFDFDALKSINVQGNGQYMCKPVIKITSTSSLEIAPPTLPIGTVGVSYEVTLTATGGTAPYVWSIVSSNLPAGLTFDVTTGKLSGTPTVAGTSYALSVKVVDSSSPVQKFATKSYTLTINPAPTATVTTTN
jgi:hypothetical protein